MDIKRQMLTDVEKIDFCQNFVWNKGEWFSYNHFFSYCYRIVTILQRHSDYQNVVVILENGMQLFGLYFAVMMTGKTIIAIDPMKSQDEIKEILIGMPEALLIKDSLVKVQREQKFCDISESFFEEKYEETIVENIKERVIYDIGERSFADTYLITFTSGTTGVAKGIKHSLNNLFGSAYAMLQKTCLPKGERFLHAMPMTYMAGILNSIFYPFIANLQIVISKRFSVKEALHFWDFVIEHKITVFWLSPAMLLMIAQVDRKEEGVKYCKTHKMYFHIGTAALTDKVRAEFEHRYGILLYASYGLSETLFISIETLKSRQRSQNSNVGELLAGVQSIIEGDGELLVNVPWMFLGYTNEKEDTYFRNEYYKTGDLGNISEDILYITGRKKDLIIRGGINISPVRIENVVMEEKIIKECAVFSVKNQYDEELTCCAYVLNEIDVQCKELEISLNKRITETLGKAYFVDFFWQIESLYRNINGKIDKKKMERLFIECNDSKI